MLNAASWRRQLELALERDDAVAVNHRMAAILASWFDVLFALNRQPHPGEKRLIEHAEALCPVRPPEVEAGIRQCLAAAWRMDHSALEIADRLIADLEALVADTD